MRYIVTAKEMKSYDKNTIEEIGIPSLVLMERAALAAADVLTAQRDAWKKTAPDKKTLAPRVLVAAGTGNNGGDGLAAGRILAQRDFEVDFYLAGDWGKMTSATACQAAILEKLGFSIQRKLENKEYDMVVDALFGIGPSRNVEGVYAELVERINRLHESGAYVCSVDIPSGICADTGRVLGCAVRADVTVAFAWAKRGELLYPGKEYTGELLIRDIGITDAAFKNGMPGAFCYEKKDLGALLPRRRKDGNKGTFGKVLLAAGSRDMSGACLLCGRSILRAGAGMVKIITPACNRELVQMSFPEAMLYTYEGEPEQRKLEQAAEWADVIVAGPGMGTGQDACRILEFLLADTEKPMVLDADGLNLLAAHEELMSRAANRKNMILTPHPGELVRLLHTDREKYRKERLTLIKELTERLGCCMVAKDAVTLVMQPGEPLYINTSGNDALATAGSGDVLAGLIGGLLAQKPESFSAAALGVYLHGLAGEAAAAKKGRAGVTASDIIEEIMALMRECGSF